MVGARSSHSEDPLEAPGEIYYEDKNLYHEETLVTTGGIRILNMSDHKFRNKTNRIMGENYSIL